jgi:phosphatidylglycerol:prolipoprotein diacylglycerol transferase
MYPFHVSYALWGHTIEFGPYSVFFTLSIIIVSLGSFWFIIKKGGSIPTTLQVLGVLFLSALIGARLLNAITHWELYSTDPQKIYSLESTGFSLYGGVIFSLCTGYVYCKIKKIDPFAFADYLAPFAGIGIAIFRIGCFLRGCCFGQETNLPWGVTFPLLSPAHIHQLNAGSGFFTIHPVHPTQLYELLFAIFLGILSFILLHKKIRHGVPALLFTILFSLFRLVNDSLRVEIDPQFPGYFYPLIYSMIVIVSVLLLKNRTSYFTIWYEHT